ncbi:MAG TPA: hypothetical protein VH593_24720 [Ktedonobacteraceae bacterium]|jgi:hypothetical protein
MTRKFSPEISQLAEQYSLGTPVKRHTHLGWIIFWTYVLGMCLLASIAFPLSMFSSSNHSIVLAGCLELIFLFGIVVSVALILMYLPYSGYECTDGFIELNRRKGKLEVKQFLHWSDVYSTHMVASRGGSSYYVTDRRGRKMSVDSRAIWRKCKRIAAQHATMGAPRDIIK